MRVEFDRDTCTGIFNCVHEWETFIKGRDAGKATLVGSDEVEDDLYVRDIPEDEEFGAKMAARVCPVDAITIYDDEGEQLIEIRAHPSVFRRRLSGQPAAVHGR